jgi:hypothetical protein
MPPKTLLIAGDIAGCSWKADSATAKLVATRKGKVMTAGDNTNELGLARTYRRCYGPTWGRFKWRTRPVPGNHDYSTIGAKAYHDYFGKRAGPGRRTYYAFDVGEWRIYALDSNCRLSRGGCKPGSPQYRWLRLDLKDNPRDCVMAVMHHPTWSSGRHRNSKRPRPLVQLLYRKGAEIVINGHDHIYERFAPAKPNGVVDHDHGVRQFIVGTGGAPLSRFRKDGKRPPHSRVRSNKTHGVLKLTLESGRYGWEFLPTRKGVFRDEGVGVCHAPPPL